MKFSIFLSTMLSVATVLTGCSSEEDSGNEQMTRAISLAKNGNWREAGQIADKLSADIPGAIAPILFQIVAYEKAGELDKATDLALQCARNNPKDFTAQYLLGRLYAMDSKRDGEAFEILERALQLRPGDLNTLILLCNLGVKRNEPNTRGYLEQLVTKTKLSNAELANAYYMQGLYLYKNGESALAFSCMDRARELCRRDNPELLLQIARFADNDGNRSNEAGYIYRHFIILYGNTPNPDPDKLQEARLREQQLLGTDRTTGR